MQTVIFVKWDRAVFRNAPKLWGTDAHVLLPVSMLLLLAGFICARLWPCQAGNVPDVLVLFKIFCGLVYLATALWGVSLARKSLWNGQRGLRGWYSALVCFGCAAWLLSIPFLVVQVLNRRVTGLLTDEELSRAEYILGRANADSAERDTLMRRFSQSHSTAGHSVPDAIEVEKNLARIRLAHDVGLPPSAFRPSFTVWTLHLAAAGLIAILLSRIRWGEPIVSSH